MDAVSHVIMGAIVASQSPGGLTPTSFAVAAGLSLAPDVCFFPLAFKLGRERGRRLWIPRAEDWRGARERHRVWVALSWDLPYSLVANVVLAVVTALIGGSRALFVLSPFLLHIAVDYATHDGEWANRPFFPFSRWQVPARASAWEWPLARQARAWLALGGALIVAVVTRAILRG